MHPPDKKITPVELGGLAADVPRRGFFTKATAFLLGAFLPLIPIASGIAAFLSPIRKKRPLYEGADAEGFFKITSLASLSNLPQEFKIIADRFDAWTTFRKEPIGTVYLQKNGESELRCFNNTCPHAGCSVAYRPEKNEYLCPCHNSAFSVEGTRSPTSPSARDLDSLEYKIEDGEVYVKFQNFKAGDPHKIPT